MPPHAECGSQDREYAVSYCRQAELRSENVLVLGLEDLHLSHIAFPATGGQTWTPNGCGATDISWQGLFVCGNPSNARGFPRMLFGRVVSNGSPSLAWSTILGWFLTIFSSLARSGTSPARRDLLRAKAPKGGRKPQRLCLHPFRDRRHTGPEDAGAESRLCSRALIAHPSR